MGGGGNEPTKGSANKATERLKVIVASDTRTVNSQLTDATMEQMKMEILQVINKYVTGVNHNDLNINHRKEDSVDLLEMSINIPEKQK